MAKRDLSALLGRHGPDGPVDPPDDAQGQPGPVESTLEVRPPPQPLWRMLGRSELSPLARPAAEKRYRRLVAQCAGQPPAVVVKALHDQLAWAYPRLDGPGRPYRNEPDWPPTDVNRIEWEVAALFIERISQQLSAAWATSATWAEAIKADVLRRRSS